MKHKWTAKKRKKSEYVTLVKINRKARKKYNNLLDKKSSSNDMTKRLEDLKDILEGALGLQYLYFNEKAKLRNSKKPIMMFFEEACFL